MGHVGGSRLGVGLIKCCDFQRSLLARSISDPSALATRGAYVFIFSLCCLLSVCNLFTTPRAGPQSRPLPLVLYSIVLYYTRSSGRSAPLLLAPAEGWGALRAPRPFGPFWGPSAPSLRIISYL